MNLYRYYDKEGALLYVGISISALRRLQERTKQISWFPEIATITIEAMLTREAASEAEREAIKKEKPRYNVMFNGRDGRRLFTVSLLEDHKKWGKLGGHIRAAKLSAKRRSEIATKAVAARELKRRNGKGKP